MRRGFTFPERLVCSALLAALILVAVPTLTHHDASRERRTLISLSKEVETAKEEVAMMRGLKNGTPVSLDDLLRGGYLRRDFKVPPGVRITVGAIGSPSDIDFVGKDR